MYNYKELKERFSNSKLENPKGFVESQGRE